ncbi:KTSC domain-containing protein [Hahella sp. CCB-MM4]|uniref:KTSC domain-containing protein n=1 Tax=Hahella sp. (strain CCB-MM4) TaxID=1926491 RepID=UPI000B9A9B8A|nr:KTSC domain-containing protein [Hahella sp. CCB-MM4]OZG75391.1 KTSC domain-containing protein [Hahella sp. CCB-MM4]
MERVQVVSSNIASIGYDPDTETLEIEFLDGSVYQYYNVPNYEHDGLMSANSHGGYLAANIKGTYSYSRV